MNGSHTHAASWASPDQGGRKAVSVRCSYCGFRSTRVAKGERFGLYGFCPKCHEVDLEPTPTRAEKRQAQAKAQLKGD